MKRAISPRWDAAVRIPPAWRWPPRSRRMNVRSTPTWTVSTPPIRALCPRPGGWTVSRSRKCSNWRAWAPRCSSCARSNSPASTGFRCVCCPPSREDRARSLLMRKTIWKHQSFQASHSIATRPSSPSVPDKPGIAAHILNEIGKANINVDMIVQNVGADGTTDFTFTVHRGDYKKAMDILQRVSRELKAREVSGDDKIVKISIVGVGMRSHAGIASQMFKTLADEGINIQMISTSEIKISVVVDEKYLELGVRALHATFGLEKSDKSAV